MNPEKLKQLQKNVRIGGKGTPRRKKKIVHNTATTDDKKLQSSLKKLSVNTIPGIEEVNMIKDDGTVIHFNNPKVQASPSANTFAVTGHGESKMLTEMLPSILNQLVCRSVSEKEIEVNKLLQQGAEGIGNLRKLAETLPKSNAAMESPLSTAEGAGEDDLPELIGNFDEPSKTEQV